MPVSVDLSRRTAIVTGGGKGIGQAVAAALRDAGARTIVWDLDPRASASSSAIRVDITRAADIASALARIEGDVDILVGAAGHLEGLRPFLEHDEDDWQRTIAVNLVGTMQVVRQVLPRMRRGTTSRIVTFGSLAGKEGLPGLAAYSAASGGVIAFTKALAREIADTGIRVNCVAPGPIDTDMIRGLGPAAVERMIADSPLRRLGAADEVAQLVLWLCSDGCTFSTGAVYDVSGGRARY